MAQTKKGETMRTDGKAEWHQAVYRHPVTLEGAEVVCQVCHPTNISVAAYRGAEGGTPYANTRGGRAHARQAWLSYCKGLLREGFYRVASNVWDYDKREWLEATPLLT